MTVTRTEDQSGPASLTVYLSSATSEEASNEEFQEQVIDMKHKRDTTILEELTYLTNAQQVAATEQDEEDLRNLREQAVRSERDAELQREVVAKRRKERELLEQARRSSQLDPV